LQADVDSGEVGTVILWRLDRLASTMRDGLNVLCDWCDKSLRIISVSQNIDLSGAASKKTGPVLFAVAEMALETRRERTMVGLEAARARGAFGGRPPGSTKAKPERAKKLADKGTPISKIVATLGVSRSTVYRYLQK
jgi:DNA invertase Pin-like site-specific DNA recombinase